MHFLEIALGPCARLGILVPVPRRGEEQTLRGRQADAVDVGDEQQQTGQFHGLGHAELIGLLDGVIRIAPGVGQAENLGLGGLRLQQIRRKIGCAQRRQDLPHHLAAIGIDHLGRLAFQGLAEGVIGREEIPALATVLDHRARGAACQCRGVVGVHHGVGCALLADDARRACADHEERFLVLRSDRLHRQSRGAVGAADQHVHAVLREIFLGLARGQVGLVLVVEGQQLDLAAQHRAAEVVDGHLHGGDAAGAVHRGIDPGHIRDEADFDGRFSPCQGCGAQSQGERPCQCLEFHANLLLCG
ncbi:hypothetical protein GALL_309930 [mine drainage metagenome]|uniref:Uncharacterized protein n=1 Tax=mine drainage metagenome TaxID=410659 RepID=A0A1J5QU30_9ZZZZ